MTNRAVVRYTAEVVKTALQIPPQLEITAIQFNPALHCYEVYLVGPGLPLAQEAHPGMILTNADRDLWLRAPEAVKGWEWTRRGWLPPTPEPAPDAHIAAQDKSKDDQIAALAAALEAFWISFRNRYGHDKGCPCVGCTDVRALLDACAARPTPEPAPEPDRKSDV